MRHGVLTKPIPGLTLAEAINQAVRNFNAAPHCGRAGHLPAEARFHPDDLPADLEVDGLSILPDTNVRRGYIRITTIDIPVDPSDDNYVEVWDEYQREKEIFAARARAMTIGLAGNA